MSHFSRVRTKLVRRDLIEGALKDLGYQPERGELTIQGFGGARTAVEIRVRTRRPGYEIGLRRVGDAYEVVADWWGIEIDRKKFVEDLTRRYAYRVARAKLEEQGFALASEETAADGRIHLVLRRMT